MQELKNPAGQGQGSETRRGGDPINRKANMAKIDNFEKYCHAPTRPMNPLFMPACSNVSASLASSFLPNWFTQQRGQK